MFEKQIWRGAAIIALMVGNAYAQGVVARLDINRPDPHPEYVEYSPADESIVTLGPSSSASNRYIALRKYDRDMKLQWKKDVFTQSERKNLDFMAVIGENILVFVSEFMPRDGVIKTYFYQYDLEGNRDVEEQILSIYPNQKQHKVDLQYVLSPNKKKLLCYKNLQTRLEAEQLSYYLFDENGEYAGNGEINLKYPDNRFNIRSVQVSNEGNLYLLGKFYHTPRIRETQDFKFLLYRYDTKSLQGEEMPIELGDKYLSDLTFKVDRGENIYVSGFYSNVSLDRIGGTVFQRINREGVAEVNTYQEFGPDFLANYLSAPQLSRGRELKNFVLKDIVLRSDGGVLLLAEKFYVTYQSYRDIYGYWMDRQVFHYEDVIVTSISNEGAIEWQTIVDKEQVSEDPTSLSYFKAVSADGAFLFYEYKPRRSDRNIYYNVVAIDGQVTVRKPLFSDYRYDEIFLPKSCEQINNREVVMVYYRENGRTLSIVRLDLTAPSGGN